MAVYPNVDTPVRNKEASLASVSRDGTRYMLKKWFSGRECDVKKEFEILQASRNLAAAASKDAVAWNCGNRIIEEEIVIRSAYGAAPEDEFVRHNRELKKVRTFIRNKVSKGAFEFLFLEYFEQHVSLAEQVTRRLKTSNTTVCTRKV